MSYIFVITSWSISVLSKKIRIKVANLMEDVLSNITGNDIDNLLNEITNNVDHQKSKHPQTYSKTKVINDNQLLSPQLNLSAMSDNDTDQIYDPAHIQDPIHGIFLYQHPQTHQCINNYIIYITTLYQNYNH